MAALPNKLIAQMAFKAGGDIFHELVRHKPSHLSKATPDFIQSCESHQGEFGVNGTIIEWKYSVDGKPQVAKQVLQDIDHDKKTISFKMLEGDLMELYKSLTITYHFENKGGVDFITWTLNYELLKADNPHPLSFLNFFIGLTNQFESHIFG